MAQLKDGTRIYGDASVDKTLTVGNISITGNLIVSGTTTTVDTTVSTIKDPIITLGADANGVVINDGLDRGLVLRYNDGAAKDGFMGWDQGNQQFAFASTTTFVEATNTVAITGYGDLRANVFFGDGGGLSNIVGANVTGTVSSATTATVAGTVTTNAQPNITSTGTLTGLSIDGGNLSVQNASITTSGSVTANGDLIIGTVSSNNSIANIYGDLNVTGNLNGRFTGTIGAKGSNTNIQFNDNGSQNGVAGFTFDKSTNTVTIGNNIELSSDNNYANIYGVINLSASGSHNQLVDASGDGIELYSTSFAQLHYDGGSGGSSESYVWVDSDGVNLEAGSNTATLDFAGKFTVPHNFEAASGDFTVSSAGEVNAAGYGSFAEVYITDAIGADGQINYIRGSDGKIDGDSNFTYSNSKLATPNIDVSSDANIQGNITTKFTGANLLSTDNTGNIIDSGISLASGILTTGDLRITNLTNTGSLLFTQDSGGNVTEDIGLTYAANTLSANNFTTTGTANVANIVLTSLVQTEVPYATTGGKLIGDASFTYDDVSSTLYANNFSATQTITATGDIEGGNIIADNLVGTQVVFAGTGGILQGDTGFTYASNTLTANNVTAVGDVEGGNVIADNLVGTQVVFAGTGGILQGDTGFTYASNVLTANNFTAMGSIYANSGTVGASLLTGTLTTAAQPNVTSVGTLANLTVSGNANVGGLITDNLYYANGGTWDLQQAAGNNNEIQFNSGDNFDSSSNFTFDPTASLFTVTGNASITGKITTSTANVDDTLYFYEGSQLYDDGGLVVHSNAGLSLEAGGTNDIVLTTNNHTARFGSDGNFTLPASSTADLGNLAKAVYGDFSTKTITPIVESPDSVDLTLQVKASHTNGNIVLVPGTANGVVEVSGARITNLADPTADQDAATKYYVDHVAQGLHVHGPAAVATTEADNLSFSGISSPFILDGYTVQDQDRVLVKNQTNPAENGIYVYSTSGSSLTRASDSNSSTEFAGGDFCFVVNGDTQADTGWVQTEVVSNLGSDPILFSQFSGAGAYTADTAHGMLVTGTVFRTKIDGYYAGTDPVTDPATGTLTYDGAGNIKVADSAVFISPNIGNASGYSLTLAGDLVANNANFGGTVFSNGNITLGSGSFVNGNINGNISGNITVTGSEGALQFASNSNTLTSSTNLNFYTGNVTLQVGDGSTTGIVVSNLLTGTLTTSAQPNVTSVGILDGLSVYGNANVDGLLTDNLYHANGSPWDFATAAGGAGEIQFSNGTDLASNASFTFNNSTGAMNVPGDIITGSGTGGNITGADYVVANYLTGTLTTSAQPNVTSVGTLTSLTVAAAGVGNILADNITVVSGGFIGDSYSVLYGNGYNITGVTASSMDANNLTGTTLSSNVTASSLTSVGTLGNLTVTGDITSTTGSVLAGTIGNASSYLYGDGSNISSITGANVTGYVPNANIANVAYDVSGSNISGTTLNSSVVTSSLTSVGTLGNLTVTGDITSTTGTVLAGNIGNATTTLYGNGYNITGVTASSMDANNLTGTTLSSNVTASSLTSVGTLTALTVDGLTNLGDIGNVEIDGGSSGQYLQTNGAGTLTWSTIDLSMIDNGTSNVAVANNGNVTVGINGTQNVISIATTGLTVTGIINASGNIVGNNITANNYLVVSGTEDATSAITGAITTTGGISAQGNIYAGHAIGFANGSGGSTSSAAFIQYNSTAGSLDFIFN